MNMLGVTIHVNGQVIWARTAVNRGPRDAAKDPNLCVYDTDIKGVQIMHDRRDGARKLAEKLLKTIEEQR